MNGTVRRQHKFHVNVNPHTHRVFKCLPDTRKFNRNSASVEKPQQRSGDQKLHSSLVFLRISCSNELCIPVTSNLNASVEDNVVGDGFRRITSHRLQSQVQFLFDYIYIVWCCFFRNSYSACVRWFASVHVQHFNACLFSFKHHFIWLPFKPTREHSH